jgi:gamma-glutamyltranspeptidase/glutathione hydrolase
MIDMIRLVPRATLLASLCGILASCTTPEPVAPPEPRVERVTVVPEGLRPTVMGPNAGVSAGHPLTAAAALEVLQNGGNAFDAGVAALLVGGVVEQDLYSLGGEALVLVYPRAEGQVTSIAGQRSTARTDERWSR